MNTIQAYIPNVTDKIVIPKPYETYEQMIIRLNHNHFASVIQRAFRHHQFRQKVDRWLRECRCPCFSIIINFVFLIYLKKLIGTSTVKCRNLCILNHNVVNNNNYSVDAFAITL